MQLKAAVSHKRKAVSEEEQDALDKQVLSACKGGSLQAVRAALASGANASCVDEDQSSPLMTGLLLRTLYASCWRVERWSISATSSSCCPSTVQLVGQVALWWPCCSRPRVLLIHVTRTMTPLIACDRSDEEAEKIARVLLDRGAQIEHRGDFQRTPLLEASRSGSAGLVELLLSRGADIKAVDEHGDTALARASCNHMHGPAIIPLLAKAGVDVNAVNSIGESALQIGLSQNRSVGDHDPANYCWALFRLGGATSASTFTAMEQCQDASLWRLVGLEMLTTRTTARCYMLLHAPTTQLQYAS